MGDTLSMPLRNSIKVPRLTGSSIAGSGGRGGEGEPGFSPLGPGQSRLPSPACPDPSIPSPTAWKRSPSSDSMPPCPPAPSSPFPLLLCMQGQPGPRTGQVAEHEVDEALQAGLPQVLRDGLHCQELAVRICHEPVLRKRKIKVLQDCSGGGIWMGAGFAACGAKCCRQRQCHPPAAAQSAVAEGVWWRLAGMCALQILHPHPSFPGQEVGAPVSPNCSICLARSEPPTVPIFTDCGKEEIWGTDLATLVPSQKHSGAVLLPEHGPALWEPPG